MTPQALLYGLGMLLLALGALGALYALAASVAAWCFLHRAAASAERLPAVSVLKPLHGAEPGLYENLASFCTQGYGGRVRLVLGVHHPADPALEVAGRIQADFPDQDIVIVQNPAQWGANRKVGNLINMGAHAAGEVIVVSDSDVHLPPGALDQIVAGLEAPDVGMVYCLYRGRPVTGGWSRLAAMDVNFRFAVSAIAGDALGAPVCLGPTMALRADTLEAIGGFEALRDVLADDFELGQAVRATGKRVACPPLVIDHLFSETSAREMIAHELRWTRTIRLMQPAGYVGSVITHYLALALLGAGLMGFSPGALVALLAIGGLRMLQAAYLAVDLAADFSLFWLVPVRDLISLGVFVAGLFGGVVVWRGYRLRVSSKGAIEAW